MAFPVDDGIKSGLTQLLHLTSRGPSRSQRDREFAAEITSLENDKEEAAPMKCHQHGCLKKTRARVAPTDMLAWVGVGEVGRNPWGINTTPRTTGH